jgi:hypothetical protein
MSMLVPFVIDADSLAPDPAWTAAQVHTCHQSLLEVWRRVGLLTHDGDSFENSRLKAAVQQLPQKLRTLWQEMLERAPLRACGSGWDGTLKADNISQLIGITSLALVDDGRAEVDFELAEDELSSPVKFAQGMEVCRLASAVQAKTFQKALDQSGIHIELGETFDNIWALRFRSLATAHIKRVAIVDRYAVSQHFFHPQAQLSGLERFLRLLDQDADGARYVSLFSAWTPELGEEKLADVKADLAKVMARLPSKKVQRLKISMVPNPAFRVRGHDRFFRFGDYVWDIGLGLQVFKGAYSPARSSAAFKTGDDIVRGYKKVEEDLAGDRRTKVVEVP